MLYAARKKETEAEINCLKAELEATKKQFPETRRLEHLVRKRVRSLFDENESAEAKRVKPAPPLGHEDVVMKICTMPGCFSINPLTSRYGATHMRKHHPGLEP